MDTLRADRLVLYRELARRVCARQEVKVIARGLDRTTATVRKYMKDESFLSILKDMDEQVWAQAMNSLQETASKSIFAKAEEDAGAAYDTLYDIMGDHNVSPHVRSRNAETILEIAKVKGSKDTDPQRVAPIHNTQLLIFQETAIQVAKATNGTNDVKASRGSNPGLEPTN